MEGRGSLVRLGRQHRIIFSWGLRPFFRIIFRQNVHPMVISEQAPTFEAGATGTITLHGSGTHVSATLRVMYSTRNHLSPQEFVIEHCDDAGFDYR